MYSGVMNAAPATELLMRSDIRLMAEAFHGLLPTWNGGGRGPLLFQRGNGSGILWDSPQQLEWMCLDARAGSSCIPLLHPHTQSSAGMVLSVSPTAGILGLNTPLRCVAQFSLLKVIVSGCPQIQTDIISCHIFKLFFTAMRPMNLGPDF